MQNVIQKQRDYLEMGAQSYQEWMDSLLSTPEDRVRYEEVQNEFIVLSELVEARMAAGLTQMDLAQQLGISCEQVARIEDCGYHACTLEMLQQYANVVGKTVSVSLV